jgi:hypothetical protein
LPKEWLTALPRLLLRVSRAALPRECWRRSSMAYRKMLRLTCWLRNWTKAWSWDRLPHRHIP